MRYIFLILVLFLNTIYANDELDKYLNDDKYKYSIVKDEKNQRVIVNLLDENNQILIFEKGQNQDYKKIFDEKLYFVETSSNIAWFQTIFLKDNYYMISCFSNYVDRVQRDIIFYFNPKSLKLIKITQDDANQEGIIQSSYIFKPFENIKTLYDFKDKDFMYNYIEKNEENSIKKEYGLVILEKQYLYNNPNKNSKTKMYLIKNDVVEILEEKEDWIYILYITKDNKEIKAWIPKIALEYRNSDEE